jgi:carboxyl-terminal processing protease
VTFDYGRHQLLLAKNANFDQPFGYDRSGLFLVDANGAYTVLSVFPGSPAASAGLAKGDVILTVNGAPTSSTSLAGLRTLLTGASGTVVHLHVRSASSERDVSLKLADYI